MRQERARKMATEMMKVKRSPVRSEACVPQKHSLRHGIQSTEEEANQLVLFAAQTDGYSRNTHRERVLRYGRPSHIGGI
jgi:hypothetical protein